MGEWLTMGVDKPEIGKTYVVVTLEGLYQIKRYVKGYVTDYQQLTADLSYKPYGYTGKTDEGFIPTTGWCGRKSKKVMFFYELPTLPEIMNDANRLHAKIAILEAEAKRLKKQLREGGINA